MTIILKSNLFLAQNGNWTGEPGNSKWIPDPNYVPQEYTNESRTETIKEIFQPYGIDGITFKILNQILHS